MAFSLLKLWTGPLPNEELYPTDRNINPLLHWVLHPIKRHIARSYLKVLQRFFGLKVIAIGGSNGKTTTRNMLLCLLPKTLATMDSITPTYNIPTSILRLRPWHKYFICEMSVEYIGDMDFYLWLAKPDIAIITLIELEHTTYFGSIENVAREENKLTRGKWIKIINGNSPLINTNGSNTYTFGLSDKFDCFIKSAALTTDFTTTLEFRISQPAATSHLEFTANLPAVGTHLAHPLAAAILTASKLGLDLRTFDLRSYTSPPHRLNIIHHKSGAILIDDSYNSNPSSAKAAIDTASELAKITKRDLTIIISQMNELGQYEASEHQKLSNYLLNLRLRDSNLYSIGPATSRIGKNFSNSEDLLKTLKKIKFSSKDLVLFKGSRGWRLDKIIAQL